MRRMRYLPVLLVIAASPCLAQTLPDASRVPDAGLAAIRGGFALPGGVDVSVGIVTDTRIDGQLVVRSAYSVTTGAPVVQVSGRRSDGALGDLALQADGAGATTADGTVQVYRMSDGVRVAFHGDRVDIDSLAGRISGSIVRNSANDRSIDIATNVDINLSGISPDRLGSLSSRVEALALDATARLNR